MKVKVLRPFLHGADIVSVGQGLEVHDVHGRELMARQPHPLVEEVGPDKKPGKKTKAER